MDTLNVLHLRVTCNLSCKCDNSLTLISKLHRTLLCILTLITTVMFYSQKKIEALRTFHNSQVLKKRAEAAKSAGVLTSATGTSIQTIATSGGQSLLRTTSAVATPGGRAVTAGGKQLILPQGAQIKPGTTLVIRYLYYLTVHLLLLLCV